MRPLNVDLRRPARVTPGILHGLSAALLALAAVVVSVTGLGPWTRVDVEPPPAAAGPQGYGRADLPDADGEDIGRWAREADVPIGRVLGWIERSASPGVVLHRVDLQAGPRTVLLEAQVPDPAQAEAYRLALSAAAGPAARWTLKSLRAAQPGEPYAVQLEAHLP